MKKTLLFLGVIILVGLALLYYRSPDSFSFLTSALKFGESGTVLVTVSQEGSVVYLGNKEVKTTTMPNEAVTLKVKVGNIENILVSKDSYWPWKKEVSLKKDEEVSFFPFLVPKSATGAIITGEDPEYERIRQMVTGNTIPGVNSKKKSDDGTVSIWVDGGVLFAEWLGAEDKRIQAFCKNGPCGNILDVFVLKEELRSVEFYKGRNDVLLVAWGEGVYALELDARGTQNFQPITQGKSPRFAKGNGDSLFVLIGEELLEIDL